jgi:TonB-dependent SusC/RagA subfamily outer membrane receptor
MLRSLSRTLGVVLIVACVAGCAGSPHVRTSPQPTKTLTSEDIERTAPGQASVEQMLMDRFPGVEVRRTASGGVSIRIRGAASFYGNTEPLLVVDGTPVQQSASGFSWLNPHDIATLTVLKNPADTAIYGLRGANGVIVITTTRPGGS